MPGGSRHRHQAHRPTLSRPVWGGVQRHRPSRRVERPRRRRRSRVWDDDLTRFLEGLADDFRGWDGERVWSVNHLALRAVFHSRGHVSLTSTLRPWISRDTWEASITTWQEAGEQMTGLAADVHQLPPPPVRRP
ncbi:MAG: DUF6228 family protein [Labedaea sp.]